MSNLPQQRARVVDITDSTVKNEAWKQQLKAVADSQDRQAFSELFAHFAPLIKAFAMSKPVGSNPAQFADDLIQEVMIKIWNKAGSYNPSAAAVSTWIFTIARNCRIDMIRKMNRHNYPLEADELLEIEDTASPTSYQSVQQLQFERQLKDGIQQLPHDQAQVITKAYMEGKSHSEIAEEMDLPLGTVKSRVRLALQKLKILVVH